jgi:hypothetical protein
MNLNLIEEPLLEFGRGSHVCPRAGITQFDVYDINFDDRRDKVFVGAVGTSDNLAKLKEWLDKLSKFIPAKLNAKQPNLFPPFCGFNPEVGFKATLVQEDRITRTLSNSDIERINRIEKWDERVEAAVEMYSTQINFLYKHRNVDVVVCVIPDELYEKVAREEDVTPGEETLEEKEEEEQKDFFETNFRRALKARAMNFRQARPLQLVREQSLKPKGKELQDEATKAWNFATALYYKANQTVPWKLVTNINRPSVCFVGIGFYRSRDRKVLHTGMAQIFDELGNGVILRGKTPVLLDKEDERPYLTDSQAYQLLKEAMTEYEVALNTTPGRLVVHKSSNFNLAEMKGFKEATKEMRIHTVDFVTVMDTDYRLFREGIYPPYRGTHIEIDRNTHILYTRGSVEYYRTQTSKYIPQPIEIRIVESAESPNIICSEILSLTKMNWNNTQFDGKYPITISCARRVGHIMKYLGEGDGEPQINYSYYM